MENKPIYGQLYSLTWATGTPCIANGNTWEESKVEQPPKTNWQILAEAVQQKELEKQQMAELDVIVDEYIDKLDKQVSELPTTTDKQQADIITKHNLWPLVVSDLNGKEEIIQTKADIIANTPIKVVMEAKDYPYKRTGSKYKETSNLSTTDIAKLVRSEINAKYPKKKWYKVSVRSEYFAWGSAIEVSINATPFNGLTPEYQLALESQDWETFNKRERTRAYWQQTRYTAEMCLFMDTLKNIQNQYNFDDSDSQTDYFHVNYYGGVQVSYDYRKALTSNHAL